MVSTAAGRTLSPKRPDAERTGLADVYPYYAGFSFDWARQHIGSLLDRHSKPHVVDPWNGSGTTTLAAASLGIDSTGIDLNPATIHIARIRSLTEEQVTELHLVCPDRGAPVEVDPLSHWFSNATARRIRDWSSACDSELVPQVASLNLVALFRVVRKLTQAFVGSNPTWVRKGATSDQFVDLEDNDLDALVAAEFDVVLARISDNPLAIRSPKLLVADAKNVPIESNSASTIVTSPPYLTRIDYAVAYSRELAVLGIDVFNDRALRGELMGSTLCRESVSPKLGGLASQLAKEVAEHSSKSSAGYYRKQLLQYLNDLTLSLNEITRIATADALMTIVVQDSYYKDIPVELAGIVVDESELRGWRLDRIERFPVKRLLTRLNSNANEYLKGQVYESVVTLTRTG